MRIAMVIVLGLIGWQLAAQVDTSVSLVPAQVPSLFLRPSFNIGDTDTVILLSSSPMLQAPSYVYQQGKLPMFCAMEDRFWRKAGIGFQFRLADKLPGR